jgi:diguanylate cyclase (GGDEF)-like protein
MLLLCWVWKLNYMNRRRHPRLDIDHAAILEYQGVRYERCRVSNFSKGGAYLQIGDTQLQALLPEGYFAEHERQEALLELRPEGQRARVTIVYLRHQGLGVCFLEQEALPLFNLLLNKVKEREAKRSTASANQTAGAIDKDLLNRLREKTAKFIKRVLPAFFVQSTQDLRARTQENVTNDETSALLFALNSLESDRVEFSQRFSDLVNQSFSQLAGEKPPTVEADETLPEELALVEKQEIDTWIFVNDLSRRVESELSTALSQLEIGLSHLCHGNIRNELNPLSPISLLTALKSVLDDYEMDIQSLQIILAAFRNSVLDDLGRFYAELLQLLSLKGVDISSNRVQVQWALASTQGNLEAGPGGRSMPQLAALFSAHHVPGGEGSPSGLPAAEQRELLASLDSLSHLQGTSTLQQLESLLTRESALPMTLPPHIRAVINAAEELVTALCSDARVTAEMSELLKHSKILIIEAIVQDPSLLDNPDHPVRRLLGAIEAMTPYVTTSQHASHGRERDKARLLQIVEAIDASQIRHVNEISEKLIEIHSEQRERFEKNRRLAISHCEKDERFKQAHETAYQLLASQLINHSVSLAIDKLFEFGWANLLVQTLVLKGEESASWKAYLRVIDILLKLFAKDKSPQAVAKKKVLDLISLIRKGFRDYPVYPEGSKRFALDLQQTLLQGGPQFDRFIQERIDIDEAYLRKQFSGSPGWQQTTEAAHPEERWLQVADKLEVDEWLIERSGDGASWMLNLAWKNPAANRYLLVNGDGFKAHDETPSALASHLAEGRYTRLGRQVQSIVERAIDKTLSSNYNELKDVSAFDDLTGLMNRRSFDLELRKRLADFSPPQDQLFLVLLDLDKFQVVNDLCGFEGGDNLLRTVTDILLNFVPDGNMLARIGDDEFSFLMSGGNLELCYQTAEVLRQAIDEYQYNWNDRLIPVSASVGLVQIDSNEQTPDDLLRAVQAACNMAKRGGRNCTRIYLASDSAYQDQRQMVQSLPGIKEALAQGRMVLFAQPIVPLIDGDGLLPHYEILLRVQNESGELVGPQEFIRAAEHYDMMRAVDRWVVEAFFAQIAPYAQQLSPEQSFSINISGKSICDGEFMLFLKQAINESNLQSGHLGFEITETVLVGDVSDTASFIEEIRHMGCTFSLDDFGSGYASFSYLKDFPVDYVKIDGVFVREILNKPADHAMINSITEIAHFMDKRVIAEFVADADTAQALKSIGVDFGQGYYFGKPAPLSDVLQGMAPFQQQASL